MAAALALLLGGSGVAVLAWPALRAAASGTDPSARGLVFLDRRLRLGRGTVCLKRWPAPGDRAVVTAWQLSIGRCARWPACCWRANRFRCKAGASGSRGADFHIVLGTAAAYWLWFVLSERISATTASLTTLAVPVVGVLGAMALVGDRPAAQDWWGFALVLAGAALTVLGSVGAAARLSRQKGRLSARAGLSAPGRAVSRSSAEPLTSRMPPSTSSAPSTKAASSGSSRISTPNDTPNSGVMNDRIDRRDAR